MDPLVIGPFVVLGLGVVAVLAAIVGHFKQLPAKNAVVVWLFGFALLGVGSYGPAFLADYSGFVKALNQLSEAVPDAGQVADVLERARKAGVSPKAREAILVDAVGRKALAAENSVEEVETTLEAVKASLPEEPENQAVLTDANSRVLAQIEVRDVARRQIEAVAAGESAPVIQAEELKPLLQLPEDRLRELQVDRETLALAVDRSQADG